MTCLSVNQEEEEEEVDEAQGVFFCNMSSHNRARAACPVPTCGQSITRRSSMRRHFMYLHPQAAVHFPGKGALAPCPLCQIQVPNLPRHRGMLLCKKAAEQAQKRAQVEANKQAVKVVFKIGDKPIENVSSFKYLGRILAANDDDLPDMVSNVRRARQRWGQISRLLMRDSASP